MSSGSLSAAGFFDEEVPRLIAEKTLAPHRTGDVIFEIVGPNGGRWKLHLDEVPSITRVDPWSRGQLVVRMDEACFPSFLDGSLDVVAEVEDGHLALQGDLSLLDELAEMWNAPGSVLDVRSRGKKRGDRR